MTLPSRRIIVLRTSRDTLVLIATTVCVTLALAYAVRQRPAPVAASPDQQVWAGQLAEVAPGTSAPAKAEPMTSASLVVPKAALALPPVPASPQAAATGRSAKAASCEAQPCPTKAALVPPARQKLAMAEPEAARQPVAAKPVPASAKDRDKRFALSDLNPLPHLPDAVRKPFSYAGTKISGWMDWF